MIDATLWNETRVLAACVDTYGYWIKEHGVSFADFCFQAADLINAGRIELQRTGGSTILDEERSALAWHAAQPENGFTHLFMYDADMTVSLEHIQALVKRKVDVVSGTYFMRAHRAFLQDGTLSKAEQFPCVACRDGKYITRAEIEASDKLIEVHSVGCGCLLVTSEALRKIGNPAFKFDWHVAGNHRYRHGEDEWFSKRAKDAGYTVWMDPAVIPDHYATVRVGLEVSDFNGYAFFKPNY